MAQIGCSPHESQLVPISAPPLADGETEHTAEITGIRVTQPCSCFKVPRDHPCRRQGAALPCGFCPGLALTARGASREAAAPLPQVRVSGAMSRGRTWHRGVWVTRRAGRGVPAESGRAVSRQKGCDPCGARAECQVNHAFLPVSPHRLRKEPRWLSQIPVSVPPIAGCHGLSSPQQPPTGSPITLR